jgi:hypothetical protein
MNGTTPSPGIRGRWAADRFADADEYAVINEKEPIMAMLSSKSHRFIRSYNYTMPEYRPAGPRGQKSRISVVVPATHERRPTERPTRTESR